MVNQEDVAVIVLAGGQGTRIRQLYPHIPKPMIPVAGYPFIEWVLRYFVCQGFRKFVLSLGYLSHVVEEYFKNRLLYKTSIITVREPTPLGTGGALLLAQQAVPYSDPLVVANGDSLVLAELTQIWSLLLNYPQVDGVIVGVRVQDASQYGSLTVTPEGFLSSFNEKRPGTGLINAGVYIFRRHILKYFPQQQPLSLELEVLPALITRGAKILVYPCEAPFLDIGTPNGVKQAENFIKKHFLGEGKNDHYKNSFPD